MNFIEFYFILVTYIHIASVSETSVSGEVIVNSVHNVILVWIRLQVSTLMSLHSFYQHKP